MSFQSKQLNAFVAILLALIWSSSAQEHDHDDHGDAHVYDGAPVYFLAEHGDFEIGYEGGELTLDIHLHVGAIVDGNALAEGTACEPEQLILVATQEAEILCPAGDLWEPTGVEVNEPLWVLPQHEQEGLPAFGFSTAEIDAGVFVDDQVQLNLRAIQGPGDFSLWEDNAFGLPTFYLATHDGQSSATFPIGLHAHFNWAFSAPGDYILVFEATAELVGGGSVDTLSIYHFKVTEIPLCLVSLPGDVNGDCVVDEYDLHIVEDNLGNTAPTWPADGEHEHGHDDDDHDHGHDDN